MSTVPESYVEQIAFYETRLEKFAENAAQIGMTEAQVELLREKTDAARAAFLAQQTAIGQARSATLAFHLALEAMGEFGSALLLQVRSHAKTTDDPGVYALASIPAPKASSPRPAPGTPYAFETSIDGLGSVTLSWKCDHPGGGRGTMYQIRRKTSVVGFVPLETVGTKRFTDTTIPKGVTQLTYEVRAVRSTKSGLWANHTVTFGTNGQSQPAPFFPRGESKAA